MDPPIIYRQLAQFLIHDIPVSIEIIPGSEEQWSGYAMDNPHFPFLLIDRNLGIPESILYKAYIHASSKLPGLPKPNISCSTRSDDELVSSTAIVLLANPAHNTALNRRKQLMTVNPPRLAPHHELRYIAALLGMKQASKYSNLWHHRRWILRRIYQPTSLTESGPNYVDEPDILSHASIPCEVLVAEFKLAARAGEIYPRNYHAWLHRYLCVQCLISWVLKGIPEALDSLHSELEDSRRWIEFHVSDYTAVQYVARLVSALQDARIHVPLLESCSSKTDTPTLVIPPSQFSQFPMVPHALALISSYPVHESLWMYLRLASATKYSRISPLYQWVMDFTLSLCDNSLPGGNEHSSGDHCSPKAFAEQMINKTRPEDISQIRNYATRFFIWILCSNGILHLDKALIQRFQVGSELPGLEYLRGLSAT